MQDFLKQAALSKDARTDVRQFISCPAGKTLISGETPASFAGILDWPIRQQSNGQCVSSEGRSPQLSFVSFDDTVSLCETLHRECFTAGHFKVTYNLLLKPSSHEQQFHLC